MSQYPPSPYNPPPSQQQPDYGNNFSYYQPMSDPLAPARRAGVMMFVMGGLLALAGLCCGAMAGLVPFDEVMSQNPALSSAPGVTPDLLRTGAIVIGVLAFLFAVALIVLGYFVRGGGMVPVVVSLALVGISVLLGALVILSGLVQSRGNPAQAVGVCVYAIPLLMLVVLLVMLVQAVKAAPRVAMMRSQYQQQYWQYQQQQQMYQAGYFPPPMPGLDASQQQQQSPPSSDVPPPPPTDSSSPGDPHGPSA